MYKGGLAGRLSAPQTFNIGDLKVRFLVKLGFVSRLWRNWTSKNCYDVITITSSKNVTHFFQFGPPYQNFWLRQWKRVLYCSWPKSTSKSFWLYRCSIVNEELLE